MLKITFWETIIILPLHVNVGNATSKQQSRASWHKILGSCHYTTWLSQQSVCRGGRDWNKLAVAEAMRKKVGLSKAFQMGRISDQLRNEGAPGNRKIKSAWEAENEDIRLTRAKTLKGTVGDEVYFKGWGRSWETLEPTKRRNLLW